MTARKQKQRVFSAAAAVTGTALGFVIIFPVFYGVLGAFKTPAEFSAAPPTLWPESFAYLQNFRDALRMMPFPRFLLNSLIVASAGTTARLLFAILAAYAIAFFDFKGKNFLFFVILGAMMFPGDTLVVTNYLTVTRFRLLDTYLGMCITSLAGVTQMFMLRQNFRTLTRTIREAALIDGCGDFRFLACVLLPVSRAVVLTLYVQSFVTQWNAYLWPLLVTNKNDMRTVQVGVAMLTTPEGTNYSLILAGVTLTLIPSLILFLLLRRSLARGISAGPLVG